jgi:hypothetical protein
MRLAPLGALKNSMCIYNKTFTIESIIYYKLTSKKKREKEFIWSEALTTNESTHYRKENKYMEGGSGNR